MVRVLENKGPQGTNCVDSKVHTTVSSVMIVDDFFYRHFGSISFSIIKSLNFEELTLDKPLHSPKS